MSKLRLSSNKLKIITGRYAANIVKREQRICTLCVLREFENDFHFVMKCPAYSAIRCKYISHYFYRRPRVFKYVSLLQSSHFGTLNYLGKYIYFAFALRKQLTNDN